MGMILQGFKHLAEPARCPVIPDDAKRRTRNSGVVGRRSGFALTRALE